MKDRLKEKAATGALICLLALMLLAGCAPRVNNGGTVSVVSPDFFGVGEELALQLSAGMQGGGRGQRLLLTTIVELDNLYATSRFGRTLSESLSTSLFRHGFAVVEIRKGAEVLIRDNSGELVLTRDVELLARQQQVSAILTGTYSLTPTTVILNLKLLAAGLELQRSRAINHLLAAGSANGSDAFLSAYER